nr:MAG TPA: Ribosome ribosome, 80S, RACK1 protein [Caudoviricetes sp.]
MDYPNDRKILFLLSHKKELTYSEKRKPRKLSNIYQDNHLFSKELAR